MKKISLILILSAIAGISWAQQGSKTKPVAKANSAVQQPALKTLSDSASYAIGVSVASFYKQQGITKLNPTLVSRAINDILGGKKTLLDDQTCNTVVTKLMNQVQETKSKPTIESGKAFLEKNKTRPEVKTTASGLQYEIITEGTGIKPLATDSVTVNYKGTLIDGTEFDNSYTRGEPITFPLNRVIAGWTEGLQLMTVGSKYKFYIPYTLAYGSNDQGPIPGGSTLIFEVELLDVKKSN
jgi:FKBP-type peptidyl-prolyl cis-trans isomerase FklB